MGILEAVLARSSRALASELRRQTLHGAVTRAYSRFARQHPRRVAELFDEHFILRHVLPLLQQADRKGETVTSLQVAELWSRQLSISPHLRQQHISQMTSAATQFLWLVGDELAETQMRDEIPVLINSL